MFLSSLNQKNIDEIIDFSQLNGIYKWFFDHLNFLRLEEDETHVVTTIALLLAFSIVMFTLDYMLKNIFIVIARRYAALSKTKLDDMIINNKVLHNITHFIPVALARILFPIFFMGFPNVISFVLSLTNILFVIVITLLFRSIIRTVRDYAKTKPRLADKPIDSYTQVASIILYFFAGVIIFSTLTGKDPVKFLVSLGAASAILMLVFKDTIMGFVASIQVSTNDMVRVGDWIEMAKFGADGTVLEINLSTVKVQNFDKTITTIPTYLLISDSFKNYRGMQVSGGRRIKRSINIKMSSIRFLEPSEINELKKIQLLKPYIEERQKEIDDYNISTQADQSMPINGRRMTNIGLFRAYVLRYTQQNPNIHKEYHLMVRHLQPTEHGLPIELYMFTNSTVWAFYETVMADIFDHVLAAIDYFHLEVFELPSSDDVRQFISHSQDPTKQSPNT
ncbi:mechanosensitive ion channel family protein [Myroides fluvii]|uniref:mechanosensitive ion channel family protein n=1 Tax=Myroides fluvii TaxID=2572594 RepID=UPI00131E8673|nr:mechanosensitive ion channel domain-containing protein [Myroides fluvii]